MSDQHTCGDAGGTKANGEPCGQTTREGRCALHPENGDPPPNKQSEHRCGDAGGVNGGGKPCGIPTKAGERCSYHDEEKPDPEAGRPRIELTRDQTEQLRKAACWMPMDELADLFGIHDDTLRRMFKRDPEVLRAYKEGRAGLRNELESRALYLAMGEKDEEGKWKRKPDKGMLIFLMKTRFGYKETSRRELTGRDGKPIQHEDMGQEFDPSKLDEEELALLDKLMDKARAKDEEEERELRLVS